MEKIYELIKSVSVLTIAFCLSRLLYNGTAYLFVYKTWLAVGISFPIAILWLVISVLYTTYRKEQIGIIQEQVNNTDTGRFKPIAPTEIKTTFDDVAGVSSAKEDLMEITDFLTTPERYTKIGAKLPKGVILHGLPGTGKTMLAKAIAGTANATFFSTSGSEFIERYVGTGASRVRELFTLAKERSPSVIFIDEIDSLIQTRDSSSNGQEHLQTINQLLVEMDGFTENERVIVIAATNRMDSIDPAFLRPGRFDRQIYVDLPNQQERKDILKVHADKAKFSSSIDWDALAKKTPGFSGAQLAGIINEAAIAAGKANKTLIDTNDIEFAYSKAIAGNNSTRVMSESDKKRIAYHEAGHALIAYLLGDSVEKVSIIPKTNGSLGYTLSLPKEDRSQLITEEDFDKKLKILLAGRQAEKIGLGSISSGASDDLKRATELCFDAISYWGWESPVSFATKKLSNSLQKERNIAIQKLLENAQNNVDKLLKNQLPELQVIAEQLLIKEEIDAIDIQKIMGNSVA